MSVQQLLNVWCPGGYCRGHLVSERHIKYTIKLSIVIEQSLSQYFGVAISIEYSIKQQKNALISFSSRHRRLLEQPASDTPPTWSEHQAKAAKVRPINTLWSGGVEERPCGRSCSTEEAWHRTVCLFASCRQEECSLHAIRRHCWENKASNFKSCFLSDLMQAMRYISSSSLAWSYAMPQPSHSPSKTRPAMTTCMVRQS